MLGVPRKSKDATCAYHHIALSNDYGHIERPHRVKMPKAHEKRVNRCGWTKRDATRLPATGTARKGAALGCQTTAKGAGNGAKTLNVVLYLTK
jgi:hypothetical protein